MNLTPTEMERLTIFTVAELARRYKKHGVKLSMPEAQALIADELLLGARRGLSHSELVTYGSNILNADEVEEGVANLIRSISIEVSLEEGTKLVTIFDPIETNNEEKIPGQIYCLKGDVELNKNRKMVKIKVVNSGDRSIQVRSHAHFFEVNRVLLFDREKAFGMRLDRPSGGGERFDPGIEKEVSLVAYGGNMFVEGFSGLTQGHLKKTGVKEKALQKAKENRFIAKEK
jgi:urease subunit gamma/beta